MEKLFTVSDTASPQDILSQIGCLVHTAQRQSQVMAERLQLGEGYSVPYLLEMAEALLDAIEVRP